MRGTVRNPGGRGRAFGGAPRGDAGGPPAGCGPDAAAAGHVPPAVDPARDRSCEGKGDPPRRARRKPADRGRGDPLRPPSRSARRGGGLLRGGGAAVLRRKRFGEFRRRRDPCGPGRPRPGLPPFDGRRIRAGGAGRDLPFHLRRHPVAARLGGRRGDGAAIPAEDGRPARGNPGSDPGGGGRGRRGSARRFPGRRNARTPGGRASRRRTDPAPRRRSLHPPRRVRGRAGSPSPGRRRRFFAADIGGSRAGRGEGAQVEAGDHDRRGRRRLPRPGCVRIRPLDRRAESDARARLS